MPSLLLVLVAVTAGAQPGEDPDRGRVPRDPGAATIHAKFVDEAGAPLADVELRAWNATGRPIGEPARSHESGQVRWRVSLGIADRHRPTIEATRPGCSSARWQMWIARGTTLDLGEIALAPPGSVTGRIVDPAGNTLTDGWGVHGVVAYTGRYRLSDRCDGEIDPRTGEFRLGTVPIGTVTIHAVQEPLYIQSAGSASVTVEGGMESQARVVVHPSGQR